MLSLKLWTLWAGLKLPWSGCFASTPELGAYFSKEPVFQIPSRILSRDIVEFMSPTMLLILHQNSTRGEIYLIRDVDDFDGIAKLRQRIFDRAVSENSQDTFRHRDCDLRGMEEGLAAAYSREFCIRPAWASDADISIACREFNIVIATWDEEESLKSSRSQTNWNCWSKWYWQDSCEDI